MGASFCPERLQAGGQDVGDWGEDCGPHALLSTGWAHRRGHPEPRTLPRPRSEISHPRRCPTLDRKTLLDWQRFEKSLVWLRHPLQEGDLEPNCSLSWLRQGGMGSKWGGDARGGGGTGLFHLHLFPLPDGFKSRNIKGMLLFLERYIHWGLLRPCAMVGPQELSCPTSRLKDKAWTGGPLGPSALGAQVGGCKELACCLDRAPVKCTLAACRPPQPAGARLCTASGGVCTVPHCAQVGTAEPNEAGAVWSELVGGGAPPGQAWGGQAHEEAVAWPLAREM